MAGGRGVALPIPRFSVTRDKKQPSWRTWAINITGNEQSVRKQGNDVYPKHKRLTPCTTRTIIFQRENSNYLIVCFTQCTLVFQHLFFFLLPTCLPCFICGKRMWRNMATSENGPNVHQKLAKQNRSSRQSRCVATSKSCKIAKLNLLQIRF